MKTCYVSATDIAIVWRLRPASDRRLFPAAGNGFFDLPAAHDIFAPFPHAGCPANGSLRIPISSVPVRSRPQFTVGCENPIFRSR